MKEKIASKPDPAARKRSKTKLVGEMGLVCSTIALVLFILLPSEGSHNGRTMAAVIQIRTLGTALNAYKSDTGAYPPSIDGVQSLIQAPAGITKWHGPYLEREIPLDPWGHNYIYICPGIHNPESYDLSSRGPDGFVGNDDDIGNWQRK
jgi:general secretion pathway protein G